MGVIMKVVVIGILSLLAVGLPVELSETHKARSRSPKK